MFADRLFSPDRLLTRRAQQRVFGSLCKAMAIVMLFAALAPGVSHVLARVSGQPMMMMEICTSQGARIMVMVPLQIQADSAEQSNAPAPIHSAAHLEHCKFCTNISGAQAPGPSAISLVIYLPQLAADWPVLFYQAPSTDIAWRLAPARAPPSLVHA